MLEHAAVLGPEDVGEVLGLVGADAADVGVQAGLPAAVAEPPAELDQRLAGIGIPASLLGAAIQPRLPADALEIPAHALEVERRPGDQEDLRGGLAQWFLAHPCIDLEHAPRLGARADARRSALQGQREQAVRRERPRRRRADARVVQVLRHLVQGAALSRELAQLHLELAEVGGRGV